MTRIAIIDDDEAVRDSLTFLLQAHGFDPQGFASGDIYLDGSLADIAAILLDVRMPGRNGVEVLMDLRERGDTTPVIMMSGHADIALAVRALKAGAQDFIEKPFEPNELVLALGRVLADRRNYIKRQDETAAAQRRLARLTPRELEIAEQLGEGSSNKEIARTLDISVRTVETHRAHILSKLEIRSTTQLVRLLIGRDGTD